MKGKLNFGDKISDQLVTNGEVAGKLNLGFLYSFDIKRILDPAMLEEWFRLRQIGEFIDARIHHAQHSKLIEAWQDHNIIVTEGINEVLDSIFAANGGTHYFGLTDGAPVTTAAGDTMGSHVGWAEVGVSAGDAYDETARVAMTMAAASALSKSTSANSVFTMNATKTVGGAFITDNATKGGTAGGLLSVAAFTGGDRSLVSADVLNMTATLTGADT